MQSEQPVGKRKYTRNACDACRARKVKCKYNNDNAVCESCHELALPCRQDRPRKRRGPPSRYLENLRRREQEQQLELTLQPTATEESPLVPPSPQLGSTHNNVLDLEQLAPFSVIKQVVNDWFELVHPVAPIFHRDTFLHQLDHDDAVINPDFTLLVVSVCAAAVSTLRRRILAYAPMITVDKCYRIIKSHDNLQDQYRVSLVRCQWKYNISSALLHDHGLDSPLIRLLTGEVTSMVAHLVHYELKSMSTLDQELVKRLHWLLYAGACTIGLHGRPFMTPVNPFASNDHLRPRELLDTEIGSIHTSQDEWQGNIVSYIPGLNALSDLFILWHTSQQADCSSLAHLEGYLDRALTSLDNLPPALRWRGGLSRPPRANFGTDVQMVNLYITQIHIRAFLLDQMYSIARGTHDLVSVSSILESRQDLVNDMLAIVYQMPEETLEANGHSLISKLRDIGLSLLNDADDSASASTSLNRLLTKLDRLDIRQANTIDPTSPLSNMTSSTIIL